MITVYPIPYQLVTNPYLDQLYEPLSAPELTIRRVPFRQTLRELLAGKGQRIAHWHFFDELTQARSSVATASRTLAFLGLLRLLKLRDVGLVWTAHNIEPHELHHPAWATRSYKTMLRLADTAITHSQAASTLIQERYGPTSTPVQVIPQGSYIGLIGGRQSQAAARAALGWPLDGFVALNVGMFRPYKGLELLVDAWHDLAGRLVITGGVKDADYAAAIRARAATNPTISVQPGFIPDDRLPLLMTAASVVVLPYRKLLTSAILLWALSCGVPVVAPDVPTVRELVHEGEQAFLFQPGDADSLNAALQRAANAPTLDSMRDAAYRTAQAFDWPTIAEKTASVYRNVAHRRWPQTQQER